MSSESRATHKTVLKHVLATAGYEDEEIKYLMETKKIKSPLTLIQYYESDRLDKLESDTFLEADVLILTLIAQYLKWYQDYKKKPFSQLSNDFTEEEFEKFNPSQALSKNLSELQISPGTELEESTTQVEATEMSNQDKSSTKSTSVPKVVVRMSDYPTFSGKTENWNVFYIKFKAVASL